jgi:hypothetical protein
LEGFVLFLEEGCLLPLDVAIKAKTKRGVFVVREAKGGGLDEKQKNNGYFLSFLCLSISLFLSLFPLSPSLSLSFSSFSLSFSLSQGSGPKKAAAKEEKENKESAKQK